MDASHEGSERTGIDALRASLEAHLTAQTGAPVTVRELARLPGGACQENFRVEARFSSGALAGDRRMVLRADAKSALPASIDRRAEYQVVQAAVGAGVRTPTARWVSRSLTRDGAWSYFLDWVDGESIGRRVLGSPKLADARERLVEELAGELARIHAITPSSHPGLFEERAQRSSASDPADATLAIVRDMLDHVRATRPALELAMAWLEDHRPKGSEVTLVHGDFRTGNFMVSPRGLEALLDWEFARWSTPAEDLAWISVRDWRFGQLAKPVGGFATRERFYAAYERASGRRVNRDEIHWWEVMGNVRWGAGSLYQGERYLAGGDEDIELIAIARRAVEMEWEALRLIESSRKRQ